MDPFDLGCALLLCPDLALILLFVALHAALPVGIYLLCTGETLWGALATSIGATYTAYVIYRVIRDHKRKSGGPPVPRRGLRSRRSRGPRRS